MSTTNYLDTFITVADDCPATAGTAPPARATPTVAARTFQMIHDHPYRYTSDDVIFTVYADRQGLPAGERDESREVFYSQGQACLRSSDLGKKYGWGIHADAEGRVALYGRETADYAEFVGGTRRAHDGGPVTVTQAMRSRRSS